MVAPTRANVQHDRQHVSFSLLTLSSTLCTLVLLSNNNVNTKLCCQTGLQNNIRFTEKAACDAKKAASLMSWAVPNKYLAISLLCDVVNFFPFLRSWLEPYYPFINKGHAMPFKINQSRINFGLYYKHRPILFTLLSLEACKLDVNNQTK